MTPADRRDSWAVEEANIDMAEEMERLAGMLRAGASALRDIEHIRRERDEWRAKHDKVVMESIAHSQAMMGSLVSAALNGVFKTPDDEGGAK